jgi:hypothetical protein
MSEFHVVAQYPGFLCDQPLTFSTIFIKVFISVVSDICFALEMPIPVSAV